MHTAHAGKYRMHTNTYRLQPLAPGVEMHRRQFRRGWLRHVHVERLRLTDVSTAIGGLVDDGLLLDFPHGLVQVLQFLRNGGHALNGATIADDLVADFSRPDTAVHKVLQQVLRGERKEIRRCGIYLT